MEASVLIWLLNKDIGWLSLGVSFIERVEKKEGRKKDGKKEKGRRGKGVVRGKRNGSEERRRKEGKEKIGEERGMGTRAERKKRKSCFLTTPLPTSSQSSYIQCNTRRV